MKPTVESPRRGGRARGQEGMALVIALLMLVLLSVVGLQSMDTVMRDRQVAGHTSRSRLALYAADAGIAQGLEMIRTSTLGGALAPGDCLPNPLPATGLPNGTSYGPDPTAPTPNVCMLSSADPCAPLDSSVELGGTQWLYTVWNLRVQGQTPDGARSRVQATVARCHAFNS
jgi:Tfp pilus assembly protein PilX